MFRLSLRLVLTLVLLAGQAGGQEEVEFPLSDDETTVDTQDSGDFSYDDQVRTRRTILLM